MGQRVQVGFSQRIQLDWLERTAELLLAGSTRHELQTALDDFLANKLSVGNNAKSTNRSKAITILLKIWVSVPQDLEPLRNEALEHLIRLPIDEHLPVHWGMTMAVYPFFSIVAETVGRLLRLQGSCTAAQAQRRIREQLGERETVSRATRRALRCFIDWGVLQDTPEKGVYQAAPTRLIRDKKLVAWLIEAALIASSKELASLNAITQTPAFFPFATTQFNPRDLESNERLELFHQGLDEKMVRHKFPLIIS